MKTLSLWAVVLSLGVLSGCAGGGATAGDDDDDGTTPQPTATPQGIGCRDIQLRNGQDGDGVGNSVYYTTALGQGTDTSEFFGAGGWNAPDPIRLCAGDVVGGTADVTLAQDVVVAVSFPQNNCLCRKYVAAGTTGRLYCSASSEPLGFTQSLDSNGSAAGTPPTRADVSTRAIGEGDLRILFRTVATDIDADPSACTPAACASAFGSAPEYDALYTTGKARSEVLEAKQNGGTIAVEVEGAPFDDDPNDGTGDCEDWASGAGSGSLAGAAEQQEDNPQANADVATVERIAE